MKSQVSACVRLNSEKVALTVSRMGAAWRSEDAARFECFARSTSASGTCAGTS